MAGTLHEDQYTCMIMSLSVLLRIRNISGENHRENQTHILCSIIFPRKSCRLSDNVQNMVQSDTPQMTIWRMRMLDK